MMKANNHLQDYDVENQSFESKTKTKESSFGKILFSVFIICGFIIAFNLMDVFDMQQRELLGGTFLFFVRMPHGSSLIPVVLPDTATVADLMALPDFVDAGSFTFDGRSMDDPSELLAEVGISQEAVVEFHYRRLPDFRKVSQIKAWEAMKWKKGTVLEFHGLKTIQTMQPGGYTPPEVASKTRVTISVTKTTQKPGFDAVSDDDKMMFVEYGTEQDLYCMKAFDSDQFKFIPLDKELAMVRVIRHVTYTEDEWPEVKESYQKFLRDNGKDDTEPQ